MSFFGKYPVSDNMGELEIRVEGLYLAFSYCYNGSAAPSRLVIYRGPKALSLGIPVPDGAFLRLRKKLSLSALRSGGFDGVDFARLVPLAENTEEAEKPAPVSEAAKAASELVSFASGGKRVFIPVRRP